MSSSSKPASLNKLPAAGTVWVASDIHMSAQAPATTRAFLEFLNKASAQADALFLPGDIFDVWIGDDLALHDPPDWLIPILAALLRTSQQTALYLGRGNRDFLMGHTLARRVGAQLLPDAVILQTDLGPVLLSHGDEYCTADRGYQRFRRLVRNPMIQRAFLSLSLHMRRTIAAWARRRSQQQNEYKPMTIMDVEPAAIDAAFRQSGCRIMVHGHTHRPAIHDLQVDGQRCQRIVLPDWEFDHASPHRGGWLIIDAQGLRLMSAHEQPHHDDTAQRDTVPGEGPVGMA